MLELQILNSQVVRNRWLYWEKNGKDIQVCQKR